MSQIVKNLNDMIMTAASGRVPAVETVMIQFMKSIMSHLTVVNGIVHTGSECLACQICGYVNPETLPERCPVCRAVSEQFDMVK